MIHRPANRLGLVFTTFVAALAVPTTTLAYDWNAKTVAHELDILDGRMDVVSGHPLATARAFQLAAGAAEQDPALATAMTFTLSSPVFEPQWESMRPADLADDRADGLQTVMFGSWLNEVRTALDMGDPNKPDWRDPLAWVASAMAWRYADYLEGRERSDRWSEATGYSSNNFQHSMQVTSSDPSVIVTPDDSMDLMEEYLAWALHQGTFQLLLAKKTQLEIGPTDPDIDDNWVSGLRRIGSVFHAIEDSSVSCTPAAQEHVPVCIPGDGHTLLAKVGGDTQVVALSDNVYYERAVPDGSKPHALLDGLYQEDLVDEVYGDFDPALVGATVLIELSIAVHDALHGELASVPLFVAGTDELNPDFIAAADAIAEDTADEIYAIAITDRFALEEDRLDLPPLPAGDDEPADAVGDSAGPERGGDEGCRIAPTPNAATLFGLLALLGLRRRRGCRPSARVADWRGRRRAPRRPKSDRN
jgi:hypothetical protein